MSESSPRRQRATKSARVTQETATKVTRRRLPKAVQTAVHAALGKKAADLVVLDLRSSGAFTDFFVIATGASARQVQAIADAVEQALKAAHIRPANVEGRTQAEWVLLDYFDFVVHVFSPAARAFYALERLWGTATQVPVSESAAS
jgi:ribosome-associated protein